MSLVAAPSLSEMKVAGFADAGLGAVLGSLVGRLAPPNAQPSPLRDALVGAAVLVAADLLKEPEEEEEQSLVPYVVPSGLTV